MIALLDHDDLNKSRRAVLLGSILLMLFAKMDVDTTAIALGSFSIAVKKIDLLGAGYLALLYFIYTFFWHSMGSLQSKLVAIPAQYRAEIEAHLKDVLFEKDLPSDGEIRAQYEALRKYFADARALAHEVGAADRKFERWKFYTFTVVPPMLIAAISLGSSNGLGAIRHFLLN